VTRAKSLDSPPEKGGAQSVGQSALHLAPVAQPPRTRTDRPHITARFNETTDRALRAWAAERGLPLAHALEQLISQALAASSAEAVTEAGAPALGAQIQSAVRTALAGEIAAVQTVLERVLVEAAAARMMTSALITYTYGDGEARAAEEACLRVAARAVARGERASLPPGMAR